MKKIIPLFLILLLILSACGAKREVALTKPEEIYKPYIVEISKPETVVADFSEMFKKHLRRKTQQILTPLRSAFTGFSYKQQK